ncbi:glycosyltransferase family 2 protein [Kiritimatiellota bacterium B12222]|nr:glycosyltransferase family 2 protein [Kiritimatiellota bacterium B12222]
MKTSSAYPSEGMWIPTGLLSWGLLLGFVVCAFLKPVGAILFLLVFDLYWLLFLFYTLILFCCSQVLLKRGRAMDWTQKIDQARFPSDAPPVGELFHVVLMPVSSESLENVKRRLENLCSLQFDKQRVLVFFAMADSTHPQVKNAIWDFHREQHETFAASYISPFEVMKGNPVSTGANLNAAAQMVRHVLSRKGIEEGKALVTCLDSSGSLDPQFLSCLSYHFLSCPDRQRRGFRPVTVCASNFWGRRAHTTMWNFAGLMSVVFDRIHPYSLGSFSRQSLSFATLSALGFWPETDAAEDCALYWKARLFFNGEYQVLPLQLPHCLNFDVPEEGNSGFYKTFSRNMQWAMGMKSGAGLVFSEDAALERSFGWKLGLWLKVLLMQQTATLWAFIFVWLGWLPGMAAVMGLHSSVAYYMAPRILVIIGMLSLLSFVVTFMLCRLARPPFLQTHTFFFRLRQRVWFWLLPLTLPLFSCVPLLAVQTRMLFKKGRR